MVLEFIKKYRFFLITLLILLILFIFNRQLGVTAVKTISFSMKEMLMVLPPIFILLGLLDIWVPRETMIKLMGKNSGLKGILLAFIFGSVAAGPLYGAFPVVAVFMKKGVKFSNILIFIGAWSTTKVPMFLFELSSLGARFAVTRLLIDIPGILIIAFILAKIVSKDKLDEIYKKAETL